jgi:hypothetical protein
VILEVQVLLFWRARTALHLNYPNQERLGRRGSMGTRLTIVKRVATQKILFSGSKISGG